MSQSKRIVRYIRQLTLHKRKQWSYVVGLTVKKTNSKFIYTAVCTHKKTGKKAKTLRNIMKHYIVRKVPKIL